jgi:ABC-type multidrug transport system fused ATPase/permease subunit
MSTKLNPKRANSRTLGLLEIIRIDDLSLASVVAIALSLFIAIFTKFFGITPISRGSTVVTNDIDPQVYNIYIIIYGIIIIVCAAFLLFRIYTVRRICRNAIEVIGKVTSIVIIGRATRLHYDYRVGETNYSGKISASIFHPARHLQVGDPILLLVDRYQPKQTVVLG